MSHWKKKIKSLTMGIISFHVSSSLSQKKVYGSSMVMKNRKLFPTSTNETDCPEICYTTTTCPYGCYPYPDFYVFPPPPPTPLPPISTHQSQNLSSHLIIIASVLASFFLLLGYYLIIVKCCSGRTRLESDGQDVEFLDENQGPGVDHPIWFINTIGLQPSVITKITVFKYRKNDVLIEGTVCSVCLSEFQEDETLRLLPKCNHAFHIPCIDTWLRSHTNCPLCRAGIISNTRTAINPSASDEQNALNLRSQEETQIENPERSDQVGDITEETGGGNGLIHIDGERKEVDGSKDKNHINLMPEEGTPIENSKSNGELGENMAETESEIELPHIDDNITGFEDSKDGGNSNVGGVFCVAELEVRRTASMDLSSDVTGTSTYRRQDLPQSNMGIVQMQDLGNSTREWSPVSLKKSCSSGGSMFLPKT